MVTLAQTTSTSQFRRRFLRSGLRDFRAEVNEQRSRIVTRTVTRVTGETVLEQRACRCCGVTDPSLHGAMTLCHYGQSHGKMFANEGN